MSWRELSQPLLVVVGPTGVGKTELSIHLAERLDGEIISADSRLFYRGMDIGTAKPSPAERARIPHHLVDIANPDEVISLADFQRMAFADIADIHRRKRLPILVGGTGQYIQAVIEGWDIPRQPPDYQLRTALELWGKQIGKSHLHAKLMRLDPEAASTIDARNSRRVVRALEVIFHTGRKFSAQRLRRGSPFQQLIIGLTCPRTDLYQRIDERIKLMLARGLLEEVQGLLAAGYPRSLPSMSAIGYAELSAHLAGEISLDEAIIIMKRRTRQFVRRQANWFKPGDERIHWFIRETGFEKEILAFIQKTPEWFPPES